MEDDLKELEQKASKLREKESRFDEEIGTLK